MDVSNLLTVIYNTAAIISLLAIALGLFRLAKVMESAPSQQAPLMPPMPEPSPEEVERFVTKFKEMREKREAEYGQRGGYPSASNVRPGRYVQTSE